MKPKLHLGPKLALENFPEGFLWDIKNKCTIENSDWYDFERLKKANARMRYARNPHPRTIKTWSGNTQMFYCPRGLFDWARQELAARSIAYELVSHVVEPRPSSPFKLLSHHGVHGFQLIPDPGQREVLEIAVRRQSGVIEGKTGSGKTFLSMLLAERLQLRTLFLVNTDVLTKQTLEEVEAILGIKPGLIKGETFDVQDFTVGSVQTLARRDLAKIAKEFGLIFQDECHLSSADTFQQVLSSFYASRVYGLSGTPKDGRLPPLVFQAIGPHLATLSSARVVPVQIVQVNTPFVPTRVYDPYEKVKHFTELTESQSRNDFIEKDLASRLDPSKKSLLLTERVDHADEIYTRLKNRLPSFSIVLYHGKLAPASAKRAAYETIKKNTPQITISTDPAIATGTDVPPWEEVFLLTPLSRPATLKQAIGRGRRTHGAKTHATVYDYVDINDPTLLEKWEKRRKVYKEL